MMHDNDDDSYVTIGTPFEIPEDDAPLKKPSKVEDQIAVDKQGRRRFHGAFTGGFSAGYFNSVGSKEGWTPSAFVSSRSKREEQKNGSRPEDFMDDEDFEEHGIAPRQLKTTAAFGSTGDELRNRKRQLQKQVEDGDLQSAIPGGVVFDELLVPSNLSMGIKILKSMGWKPGQGIGEKVALKEEGQSIKKTYGCMRPDESDTLDMSSFQRLLAPEDVAPISYQRKDNKHGLGYSGMDPYAAIFGKGAQDSTSKPSFRPTGTEKRGIRGQAFGVGVFEDEDEDIYHSDNLSNYDISMTQEDERNNYGWTGAPKIIKNKGCLEGFVMVKNPVLLSENTIHQTIQLPRNYVPKAHFDAPNKSNDNQNNNNNINNQNIRHSNKDTKESGGHRLTSDERGVLLGVKTKKWDDVSKWTLKWDKPGATDDTPTKEQGRAKDESLQDKETSKNNRFSSRWDKEIHQERPKATATEPHDPSAPVYDPSTKTFRPFAKYPNKQARYEEYLRAKKNGLKLNLTYDRTVTEWERERELDEFARASILYRPLSNTFSNRFTPATSATDESAAKQHEKKDEDDTVPCDRKAARMGMFGKMTRTVLEWHPEKLLCKRFNIPDPYPNSKIRGVPGRGRKNKTFEEFFEEPKMLQEETNNENDKEEDFSERLKSESTKSTSATTASKKKIKIGPLSHLNQQMQVDQDGNKQLAIPSLSETEKNKNIKESEERPPIDLFKAIFDTSSTSDSSDDDEDNIETQFKSEKVENMAKSDISHGASTKDRDNFQSVKQSSVENPGFDVTEGTKIRDADNSKCDIDKEFKASSSNNRQQNLQENSSKTTGKGPLSFLHGLNTTDKLDPRSSTVESHRKENYNRTYKRTTSKERDFKRDKPNVSEYRAHEHSESSDEYKESLNTRSKEKRRKEENTSDSKKDDNYKGSNLRNSDNSDSDDDWEESSSKKKSKHKKKKDKKRKKDKKSHKKSKKEKHRGRERSPRRHKRKQNTASDTSSSDEEEGADDDVSLVPSNAELLEKLRSIQKGMKKRPSAADFM